MLISQENKNDIFARIPNLRKELFVGMDVKGRLDQPWSVMYVEENTKVTKNIR